MKVFYDRFVSLVDTYKVHSTRPVTNELHGKTRNVVDYILVTKDIKIKDFSVLPSNVSDHLPLGLNFEI